MKRTHITLLTILSAIASIALPAHDHGTAIGLSPEVFQRIEAYAEQTRNWSGTPGISLAITSSEQTLFTTELGYADLKLQEAVEKDTLFQIGSISKSFTALALLALAEEGKVDLDEPVTKVLPWFSINSEFAEITPRHLLTHTAGIPANRDDFPSTPYMAYALREQQTAWAPGTRFYYSNVDYQVLSVLLEKVAQKSWADVVRERILDPLGMTASEPSITYESRNRQAVGYIQADGTRPAHPSYPLAEAPFFEYFMGDGCVSATASDMATYLRMWLNQGRYGEDQVFSEDVFTAFIQPLVKDEAGSGYGCGVEVTRGDDRFLLGHMGGMVGHVAIVKADMNSGYGVVVLSNGPGQTWEIASYALDVLNAASSGLSLPEIPANPNLLKIDNAADYSGSFSSPDGEELIFRSGENSLHVLTNEGMATLERSGTDRFYCLHPGLNRHFINFQRNKDGRVVSVTHGPRWFINESYGGPTHFTVPDEWKAYVGQYHSPSPWFQGFTVFVRQGELWCETAGGGETTAGTEIRLSPFAPNIFLPSPEPTPERVIFDQPIDGQSWRASWSGHRFYRAQ